MSHSPLVCQSQNLFSHYEKYAQANACRTISTRGFAPARQDTFVVAKVSKTIAPAPRPSFGRIPCVPRPFRRGKSSRPCRSSSFPLSPKRAAVLGSVQVAGSATENRHTNSEYKPLTQPSIVAEGGFKRGVSEPSAGWRVPERCLERNAQGIPRIARDKSWAVISLPTFFARAKKVGRERVTKKGGGDQLNSRVADR